MKKILGVTGGIGAGKSEVTRFFKELGATVVDADAISREILEPAGKAYLLVIDAFGKGIVKVDDSIDRKKLAGIVFHDEERLKKLNEITHPLVFEEMQRQIDSADTELVCLDVPLLFSCDSPFRCDRTLAVLAPKELRIERVVARDGCTREQAEARMANQLSDEILKEKADICLCNDGDILVLKQKVSDIFKDMVAR